MLHGKRESEWNHTAALMMLIQRVAGNKHARFCNPFGESNSNSDREAWLELKKRKRESKDE